MRNALFSGGSRKRLNMDNIHAHPDTGSQRHKPALVANLVHNVTGSFQPSTSDSPQNVIYSSASFNANELSSDQRVFQVGSDHLFSAIIKAKTTARGGNYLRQHLYQELLAQRQKTPGDLSLSLKNSIAELNKGFQSLHPFNLDVLQGIQAVVAFADFSTHRLNVASNGGCRCILGSSRDGGAVDVIADVGRNRIIEDNEISPISNVADVPLDSSVNVLILGSTGFWDEVAPYKAVLRAHHFFQSAPNASNCSAAANLINYSLHCVTQRLKAHPDRRMVSLNSVSNLVSLQAGHKGQFKYGHKQPVRRRRADVHDDLTAMVTFFDWKGQVSVEQPARNSQPVKGLKSKAKSKWAVVRMVFKFHIDSSNRNLQTWRSTVLGVLQQSREAKAKQPNFFLMQSNASEDNHPTRSSGDSGTSAMSAYSYRTSLTEGMSSRA